MTWRQFGLMCVTGLIVLAGMAITNLFGIPPVW
jgi:hypothetical protein